MVFPTLTHCLWSWTCCEKASPMAPAISWVTFIPQLSIAPSAPLPEAYPTLPFPIQARKSHVPSSAVHVQSSECLGRFRRCCLFVSVGEGALSWRPSRLRPHRRQSSRQHNAFGASCSRQRATEQACGRLECRCRSTHSSIFRNRCVCDRHSLPTDRQRPLTPASCSAWTMPMSIVRPAGHNAPACLLSSPVRSPARSNFLVEASPGNRCAL